MTAYQLSSSGRVNIKPWKEGDGRAWEDFIPAIHAALLEQTA